MADLPGGLIAQSPLAGSTLERYKLGGFVPLGASGDSTAPVIGNFDPPVGTPLARSQLVTFDVTDETLLVRCVVIVELAGEVYVVHDGDRFCGSFTNYSSRSAISGGFHYSVRPNGGWTHAPRFEVLAFDTGGNEGS